MSFAYGLYVVDVLEDYVGKWEPVLIKNGVSAFGIDEITAEYERCSECGFTKGVECDFRYCPNCGVRMTGE